MRSCQKPGVENVHTMLRMILPKKTSFEFLTQWDVNLIVNHINSTPRKSLDGKTPYEAARESLGEEVLKKFQLRPIPPDEVNLTPKLIHITVNHSLKICCQTDATFTFSWPVAFSQHAMSSGLFGCLETENLGEVITIITIISYYRQKLLISLNF